MAELLAGCVARRPDAPAVADDREEVSWVDIDRRVNRWVSVLRGQGLSTGDRVAFVSGNRRTTFEALLACLHAGLVAVPVSWRLTPSEIAHLLADSDSRVLLADPAFAGRADAGAERAGIRPALRTVLGDQPAAGLVPSEKLLASADETEPPEQCSGSVMLYTSATTGRPKGVLTTLLVPGADLGRLRRTVTAVAGTAGLPQEGRTLLLGPWYHAAQLFFSLFPLLNGSSLVLRRRFDAARALADLARERITACHLVPTQFIRFLALPEPVRAGFSPSALELIWHGGAECPVPVKRQMIEWWGPVLREYYAATEAGIVSMIDSAEWLSRPGSVGRPVPGTEVAVVGPDGAELPPGTVGAVYVRREGSRGFHYHNAPEQTVRAYRRPGMFTVGDLGYLDVDGYLYLTGRADDTIISGGVNIYPAEVEAALAGHPAVRDVVVFGVPDGEFGERVAAAVEVDPATGIVAEDLPDVLDQHCRAHLADFKRPRRYRVMRELPRGQTGKVSRRRLRESYPEG